MAVEIVAGSHGSGPGKKAYRRPKVRSLSLEEQPALLMVTCTIPGEEFCATCGNCRQIGACPADPIDC